MIKYLVILLFSAISIFAIASINSSYTLKPNHFPEPTYDFKKNPLKAETIELGRALFYDPILSADNTISCASCHSQYNAFAHTDHPLSHGIGDKIGTRNAPALINLAWQNSFMWDGAINHLDMQALAPISNSDEMGESIENVVRKLQSSKIYPKLFAKAFNDTAITGERTLKAVSQFLLTLVSADSKYDSVVRGLTIYSEQEQNGYKLFKTHCNSCHTEPLFTNGKFERNGLPIDFALQDFGRLKVTDYVTDYAKFKIPTLRNIEFSYPYMHDGRFKRIKDVLNHYTTGITDLIDMPQQLKTIKLTSNEKVDLTAFLLTLSDRKFVFNPEYSYPKKILLNPAKE